MLLQDKIYVKRGILVIKSSIYFVDSTKGKLNLFSLSNKLIIHRIKYLLEENADVADVQLYDNKHKLIKCKCKYRDMLKAGLAKE